MEHNQIVFNYEKTEDINHYFSLISDVHIGHENFNKKLFIDQMEEAKKLKAHVLINGDLFDLIIPNDKKRYSVGNDPYKVDAYFNQAFESAYNLLEPYVEYLTLIGVGNHEVTTIKFNGIDPVKLLIYELNKIKTNGQIIHGGYTGFLDIFFKYKGQGGTLKFNIFYNHAQGGSSEVTKGTIDLSRRGYVNANIIWLGHKHTRVIMEMVPYLGTNKGTIVERPRTGIITGSYLKNIRQYDIKKSGYRINYGEERMRTLQATGGGVILNIKRSGPDLISRIIS